MPRTATVLAVLALTCAACGSVRSVGDRHAFAVGITEYRLAPNDVRAPAGELRIYVRNLGRLTHNLVITSGRQVLAGTKPIAPGASAWLFVDLGRGQYRIASNLFSDEDLGTYGTLTIG